MCSIPTATTSRLSVTTHNDFCEGQLVRQPRDKWLTADFNGIHGDVLCVSHHEHGWALSGEEVPLRDGMIATVAEPDANVDGEPDFLIATGVVERSPEWLQCAGSKWILRIDEDGVYHLSEKAD